MTKHTSKRQFWKDEELKLIRRLYPDTPTKAIAQQLGRSVDAIYKIAYHLELRKSAAYLASPDACRLRRGDKIGASSRFLPGHVPANKGMRRPGYAPGRMAQTQFKKSGRTGIAAKNWCPIGTILTDTEGYQRIKVREGKKGEAYGFGKVEIWPLLNRHIWEQHNGPIPPNHAVVFKDGDRTNVAIENLELLSRRELMARNSSQRWGKEVFGVIQLRGALNRKLRRLSEKQNERSSQPSL